MTITREDVIRYIEGLSSEELGELADEIQKKLGLPPRPALPVFRTDGPALITGEYLSSPEFDLVLTDAGPSKIMVIKVVRELWGMGLKEAKDLVESAPVKLRDGLSRDEAHTLASRFTEAGARVEVR